MRNVNIWKKIVLVLVIIAALAMLVGGYTYYDFIYPGSFWVNIAMAMENCMESLLFNPVLPIQDIILNEEFMAGIDAGKRIIILFYSLAMVLAPFVDILIIFSVMDSLLHLFVGVGFKKRRILIVGYNDKVRKVIERKNENGKVYLWTDYFLSTEEERDLYFKNVIVKMNGFSLGDSPEKYEKQKSKFDKFMKRKNITDVMLLDESDAKNLQYYMALSSCEVCRQRTIHFYVHNKSFEAENMLREFFDVKLRKSLNLAEDSKAHNTHMDLRIFNYDQIQAEILFDKLPLYTGNDSGTGDVHLLIAGGDSLCRYIALHAMNQGVFSPNNKIFIDIVNDDIDEIQRGLSSRFNKELVSYVNNEFSINSDKIDGSLTIRLTECSLMSPELISVLHSLQENGAGAFTYVVLGSGNADENLHTFRSIGADYMFALGGGVPVALRMSYSAELKTYLSSYGWCRQIYLMGENEEYLGLDSIINLDEEAKIRTYHRTYDDITNAKVFAVSKESDNPAENEILWNKQKYFARESNRALYHHRTVKSHLYSDYENSKEEMQRFWAQTVVDNDNRDRAWSNYLLADGEYPALLDMAKTEHRRWSYFMASDGWRYSPEKDTDNRMHDCLCNWDNLVKKRPDTVIYDLISSPLIMNE
ncbi:MAG: hypothetical protein E7307_13705 [Butyrivibrio sp.]|nr:hypothetical protein [Butyrivibrio sp.]